MTRFERRLAIDTAVLGTLLTLLVIAIDWAGGLQSAENYLSDHRARYCQHFAPPPTDKIVHLDIDDNSLQAIGRWPWPRSAQANIVRELNRAGANAVALDVIYAEPERPTAVKDETGAWHELDEDATFVAACAEKGNVLIPVSLPNLSKPPEVSPIRDALISMLYVRPETEEVEAARQLTSSHPDDADLGTEVEKRFAPCLQEAILRRLITELDSGRPCDLVSLRRRLLPNSAASGVRTVAFQSMETELPQAQSYLELRRLSRPLPSDVHDFLVSDAEELPIPSIAHAAAYSGFVDFLREHDGVVRSVPLWAASRGRLVPHMALSLACAALDVDINDVRITPTTVTLPLHDGRVIAIPVRTVDSEAVGKAAMFMDIPWFGKSGPDQWLTMYDWPRHRVPRQHFPATTVWDVLVVGPQIERNNQQAYHALEAVIALTSLSTATRDLDDLHQHHPAFSDADGWNKFVSDAIDQLPPGYTDEYADYLKPDSKANPATLPTQKERDLIESLRQLVQAQRINAVLVQQRTDLQAKLRSLVKGKIVLIGSTAAGTVDRWPTRIHAECPGVAIHGVIINAILTNRALTVRGRWVASTLTLVIGVLATIAAARLTPWKALIAAGLLAGVYLLLNGEVGYDWSRVSVGMAGPVVASALIWSGCTLFKFIRESVEKARITSRFRSYVDPKLVNYVLEHPERAVLDGENRELTVVFTDLQGFTTLSEKLKEETVHLLNQYLGIMQPIIDRHHGLVNKFLGDGIMFFFGAPDPVPGGELAHARAAVDCVVDMQAGMVGLNEDLARRGLPTLRMRVGVSSGDMIVGDAGSRQRSDYTVLGDRVNFASRLEGANKATGTLILLSERTVELLDGAYLVRPIGRLQVVGKKEPVMTYEPIARAADATDAQRKLVELTRDVVDCFVAADFAACTAAVDRLVAEFGQSKLASLYHHLCAEYTLAVPADFAGQIKLESK